MNMSGISPVKPIGEYYRERDLIKGLKKNGYKLIDKKIQFLILSQIRSSPLSLFGSATTPSVVPNLVAKPPLPTKSFAWGRKTKGQKRTLKQENEIGYIPLGLSRCKTYPPLNSILQLMLFIPFLREIFSFSPQRFPELNAFIAQYKADQKMKLPISNANTSELLKFLKQNMPANAFKWEGNQVDIKSFLTFLLRAVFTSSALPSLLRFHVECDICWNKIFPFSSIVDLPMRPADIFIAVKGETVSELTLIPRQFFTKPDSYCYDLDAFVEYRSKEGDGGDYITYLKSEGGWFQCNDETITPMRSNQLVMPLNKSILLHYQRVWP